MLEADDHFAPIVTPIEIWIDWFQHSIELRALQAKKILRANRRRCQPISGVQRPELESEFAGQLDDMFASSRHASEDFVQFGAIDDGLQALYFSLACSKFGLNRRKLSLRPNREYARGPN